MGCSESGCGGYERLLDLHLRMEGVELRLVVLVGVLVLGVGCCIDGG